MSIRLLHLFVICIIASGCAQISSPSGGDKDSTAPLVTEAVPPNLSTHFNSPTITIEFDEYVQLNDAYNQIIISPPLNQRPKYTLKKKILTIDFEGQLLKDNTTYTIQLGEAIEDYTERNKAKNLSYVFSTGPVLDSARVVGKVFDAYTLKPATETKVMLYRSPTDSTYLENKPDYFAISDTKGQFEIRNLPIAEFTIIALKEQNANFIYDDPGNEDVGFLVDYVSSSSDSILTKFNIPLFTEEPPVFIQSIDEDSSGFAKVAFSKSFNSGSVWPIGNDAAIVSFFENDSLFIQVTEGVGDHPVEILQGVDVLDTLYLERYDSFNEDISFRRAQGISLIEKDSLKLDFDRFIPNVNSDIINLYVDSIKVDFEFKTVNRTMAISAPWKGGNYCQLELLPASLEGYGCSLGDTVKVDFTIVSPEELGQLNISVLPYFKDKFILEVIKGDSKVVERVFANGNSSFSFSSLLPGEYRLRLVQDSNADGKWTSGGLGLKIVPEPTYYFPEPITIRSRWEQDIEWLINTDNEQP